MWILRIFLTCLTAVPLVAFWAGCSDDQDSSIFNPDGDTDLALLALGDSYTVGQSIRVRGSWPYQLADSLAAGGDSLRTLDVIARTGWTTRNLLDAVRDSLDAGALLSRPYDLTTLMIGVNNQFQGIDQRVFEAELDTLITLALELAGNDPSRVIGFSIPDYGMTPVGELYGRERIAREIEAHNAILSRSYAARGILMLDVTTLSRRVEEEPELVASDGLHYSRLMYGLWVELMLPTIKNILLAG